MSIIQFLRILWAHRILTLLTVVATMVGAVLAILIVPPSYEGKTRVMLNTLKPDPVTGEVIDRNGSKTYISTQLELIKDYGVAGQAVDSLGWLSNPAVLSQYSATNSGDGDLRRSLAQRIIERTRVNVPTSTNILEISFRAATPDEARSMANALRDAYIDSTLASRRREATRNAAWYTAQAEKERGLLSKADEDKTAYERQAGIVMEDEKTDIETARLRSLAGANTLGAPMMTAPVAATSPSALQLAQLDAQIAQASKSLGPNHPAMIEMKARRATLAKAAADEVSANRAAANAVSEAAGATAGALNRAVAQQTSRVIANRDKIERLTQLQGEVNLHREEMQKMLARAAELRQEAAVADSGITVLSEAVTPRSPSFPNKPLILGGALVLGAGVGLMLSLLIELLNRRVRGVEDLENGVGAPLLAVITSSSSRHAPNSQRKGPTLRGFIPFGRKIARA